MDIELLKKTITEAVGADEANGIVESLVKYRTELEAGVTAKITEGVKEAKVKLEAEYLGKLEAAKVETDKQVKEELTAYEKKLATRVKAVLEKSLDSHGDRLAKIQEDTAAKRGSVLLQEVEALVTKARTEITEQTKVVANPEEVTKLQAEVKALKESAEASKKAVLEAKARANVAEQETKELRESLEASLNVVVEETEPAKTKPAGEEHHDSTGIPPSDAPITESQNQQPKYTPEMAHMRRMAGIKT